MLAASFATAPLSCAFGAPRGIRTPNRQIRSLPPIVRLVPCGPSALLTSQNLVLPVRLVACGPPGALSSSVKNSVNDGLSRVEHQISIWCSRPAQDRKDHLATMSVCQLCKVRARF
jgi:hypothetical protein